MLTDAQDALTGKAAVLDQWVQDKKLPADSSLHSAPHMHNAASRQQRDRPGMVLIVPQYSQQTAP